MIRQEIAAGDRALRLTDHFLAPVLNAAGSPHETWILPRQHHCLYEASLSELRAHRADRLFVSLRGPRSHIPAGLLVESLGAGDEPDARLRLSCEGQRPGEAAEVVGDPEAIAEVAGG